MALPGDVEFFTGDGGTVGCDEDAVDIGARPVPRWAFVVAAALVVSAVIAIGATRPQSKPAAPDSKQAAPTVVSTIDLAAIGRVGPALRLGAGVVTDARDAVTYRSRLYVLRSGAVSVIDVDTKRVDSVSLSGGYAVADGSPARLLFDANADRLWVLAVGARVTQLIEINASRMLLIRHVSLALNVRAAAAMYDHVYLATPAGLADLRPGATNAVALPGADGSVSSLAADPDRDRILALDGSRPYSVVAISTHGVATRRTFGNLVKGSIAVVGHAVWVGGYGGDSRAFVTQLDPIALAPVQTSAIAVQASRVIVSPGTQDIWVSTDGPGLWCVNPRDGGVLQHWPTARAPVSSQGGYGPVQSRVGGAYAIDGGRLVALVLASCAG